MRFTTSSDSFIAIALHYARSGSTDSSEKKRQDVCRLIAMHYGDYATKHAKTTKE
jgi:hypothetical protein